MKGAEYWLDHLKLEAIELGGYFGEGEASSETIPKQALPERFHSDRRFYSNNYYLLARDLISPFPSSRLALHQLNQDEQWFFLQGTALKLYLFLPHGEFKVITVGDKLEQDQVLLCSAPHNTWFGAELQEDSNFALCACSLAPGWDPADSITPTQSDIQQLITDYPAQADIINRLAFSAK
ncbi:cupin domain-containing protein [Vibrio sp. Of7-15]|uniref:cupin domain-containing protein n=1 Tax=Vibrio sp. Of7-15 TaxID=2724879 RepID=UPI001EF18DE0|nr:cupin domain-containing protein [Vibrio sp. Of7-15]MCG7497466.1 cupin domain-containing protein [Vibrio sp. Of7-15]